MVPRMPLRLSAMTSYGAKATLPMNGGKPNSSISFWKASILGVHSRSSRPIF